MHLSQRKRLVGALALSAAIALIAAAVNSGMIGLLPPRLHAKNLQIAAATTHVLIDTSPSIVQQRAYPQDLGTLIKRAELLGRVLVSPPVLERVAQRTSIPSGQLGGLARTTASVPLALTEPDSERRASEIAVSRQPYKIEVQSRPTTPVLDIYTQAPTTDEAIRLANASVVELGAYMRSLAAQQGIPDDKLVALRQLGGARGGIINARASKAIAMLTFLVFFALTFAFLFGLDRLQRRRRGGPAEVEAPGNGAPAELEAPGNGALALRARRPHAVATDDWPHTTRVLPWLLAGFIAILWLVPFNAIELNMSFPIDLKLDRLVLPFVVLAWACAFVAAGRLKPRLRLTWIHVVLGALLACAFLSVVLDARYLNQTGELTLSLKQLPLLVSYVSLFVVVASGVRRTEVPAFLNYTLILAVLCSLGMIYEYRFDTNLFYQWSDKLLPGFFTVSGQVAGGAVDELGRRLVRGPADVSLEAVGMLCMAFPVALVGLLQSTNWRRRTLYALAICLLVAAMVATYRKSALLAPVSVVMTLAYFRRRELLKLAPLGMVLIVVVSAVSPGAIHSTVLQFTRSDATSVSTVDDRASDYDAVRPDVFTHLAFGRGWGSYNHQSYRILDSEILHRLIETGIFGLIALLMVPIVILLSTRKTIASREPTTAPIALIGAAVAVAFLVLCTLFDMLGFPHGPYILLYMVGLVAVAIERREPVDEPSAAPVRARKPRPRHGPQRARQPKEALLPLR